jgi:hypothetical protein
MWNLKEIGDKSDEASGWLTEVSYELSEVHVVSLKLE